jgi:hypothetical protein
LAAVNQTSSPFGARASPCAARYFPVSVFFLPARSTTATVSSLLFLSG